VGAVVNKIDQEIVDRISEHFKVLRERADSVLQPPKPLKKYPDFKGVSFSRYNNMFGTDNLNLECYFYSGVFRWSEPNWEEITKEDVDIAVQTYEQGIEDWRKLAAETKKDNEEVIAHNKLQREHTTNMMKVLGIYPTYTTWGYKTSRSKNMTKTSHKAGFLGDLERVAPIQDLEYGKKLKILEAKKESILKFGERKVEEANKLREEKAKLQKQEEKTQELAFLRTKYTPDNPLSSNHEILLAILKKNKYLRLAHFLEANRNDWTCGYEYAEVGILGFNPDCDLDDLIVAEIQELVEDEYRYRRFNGAANQV